MKVLLTGATGQIGRRLVAARAGDTLIVVTRDAARAARRLGDGPTFVEADPVAAGPWQQMVDGCDAVVHLAGAGVADRRWSAAYKSVMVASRVDSTRRIVEAIESARRRPAVLVNASAVGWYGECGDRPVDETAPAGDDFLARLAVQWEAEARRAAAVTRVVCLRTGIVLDAAAGPLAKMLPIFRLGLGGPLGSGRQHFPWIHWRDMVGLIDLALRDGELAGPMNVVAPHIVTNRVFTRALGRVLRRPALLPVPVLALRLVMGELGAYAAISQRVVPAVAARHGYDYQHPDVEPALADLLGG